MRGRDFNAPVDASASMTKRTIPELGCDATPTTSPPEPRSDSAAPFFVLDMATFSSRARGAGGGGAAVFVTAGVCVDPERARGLGRTGASGGAVPKIGRAHV